MLNNPNNKEKKCSEYHKSPMQVCLCSCHKSGILTQGCDFPVSTPPVEKEETNPFIKVKINMKACSADQLKEVGKTLNVKCDCTSIMDVVKGGKKYNICELHTPQSNTMEWEERINFLRASGFEISPAIKKVIEKERQIVRKETIRECVEKILKAKRIFVDTPLNQRQTAWEWLNDLEIVISSLSKDIEQ